MTSSDPLLTAAAAEFRKNETEIARHWQHNGKPRSFDWHFQPVQDALPKAEDVPTLVQPLVITLHIYKVKNRRGDVWIDVGMSKPGETFVYGLKAIPIRIAQRKGT